MALQYGLPMQQQYGHPESRLSNSLDTGLSAEFTIVDSLHTTPTHLPSYDFAMHFPDIAATAFLIEQLQRHIKASQGVWSPYLRFFAWLQISFLSRGSLQIHRNSVKCCHTTTASGLTLQQSHIKLSGHVSIPLPLRFRLESPRHTSAAGGQL